MDFGYRLMQGKNGVAGHIRGMGEERKIWVRNLPPRRECALYRLAGGESCLVARQRADRDGMAVFACDQPGRLYLTAEGQVTAWEAGPDAEETYCMACACRERENAARTPPPIPDPGPVSDEASPDPGEPQNTPPAYPWQTRAEPEETHAEDAPPYSLREGGGEPVDALPPLRWPDPARELQGYFRGRMPFAPFSAPGWRFVRIPSGIPGAAYCAAGYLARDGRVCKTALAVPGAPHRPPAPLPGFRYRAGGEGGTGYWVRESPC